MGQQEMFVEVLKRIGEDAGQLYQWLKDDYSTIRAVRQDVTLLLQSKGTLVQEIEQLKAGRELLKSELEDLRAGKTAEIKRMNDEHTARMTDIVTREKAVTDRERKLLDKDALVRRAAKVAVGA